MDAVYLYKHTNSDELLYSIRLLKKFYPSVGQIWVIGDKPPAAVAAEVIHVLHRSKLGKFADQMLKFSLMVRNPMLSDQFILMMDDVYLTAPFNPQICYDKKYPTLKDKIVGRANDPYKTSIMKTGRYLTENDMSDTNYELHIPVVIEKQKALYVTNNIVDTDFDLQIKSLYFNFYPSLDGLGAIPYDDVKNIKIEDITAYLSTSNVKFYKYKQYLEGLL